jgi:hypothetical protein
MPCNRPRQLPGRAPGGDGELTNEDLLHQDSSVLQDARRSEACCRFVAIDVQRSDETRIRRHGGSELIPWVDDATGR